MPSIDPSGRRLQRISLPLHPPRRISHPTLAGLPAGTDVFIELLMVLRLKRSRSLPSKVITMIGENNGVVAGLDNGFIYDISRDGLSQQRQAVAPGLIGIALVTTSNTNPVLAGTSSGVFDIPNFGPATHIDNGTVSTIFSTGSSLFAEMGSDSVFHYNANGTRYGAYPKPSHCRIRYSIRARPASGVPNASQGIFALCGNIDLPDRHPIRWERLPHGLPSTNRFPHHHNRFGARLTYFAR